MPQMRSLCSLVLGRQSPRSAEYPVVLSNRTIARTVRRTQPLTQSPHQRRPTSRIVSFSITRSIRGTQIPIARDEPPSSPFPRFPPLEVFRRRPPMRAPPLRQRPASENLHNRRHLHRGKLFDDLVGAPHHRLPWCSTYVIVGSTPAMDV